MHFLVGITPVLVSVFSHETAHQLSNHLLLVGTVLSYIFYWLTAAAILVYMKYSEGRTKIFGFESAAGRRRRETKEAREAAAIDQNAKTSGSEEQMVIGELPR